MPLCAEAAGSRNKSPSEKGTNMTYYVMLSNDIPGIFGSKATPQSIIKLLKDKGVSDPAKFNKALGLKTDGRRPTRRLFESHNALLFGTDKESREDFVDALGGGYFRGVLDIGLAAPQHHEWLACVTFVDTDGKTAPKFQVVALVGSSALQEAGVVWPDEHKPAKPWATHVAESPKTVFDIMKFSGRGQW
jgi:hypothetical protein